MIFNVKPLSNSSYGKITGLEEIEMDNVSLFIDDTISEMPSCFPNCRKAELQGFDMSGQDLVSDFSLANLKSTNLSKTYLYGANFAGAKLHNANFSGADLYRANLSFADLTNANMTSVDLMNAKLSKANLTNADLSNAMWYNTTCPDDTKNRGSSPCTAEQLNLA